MRSTNGTIWVQTRAHWNSGGPECLVQLACALHDHGHRVAIYPTRIVPRFVREYPCITKLPQRPVSEARRDEDIVIGPADHACPADAVEHAWVWMLDTRSAARYRGGCRAFAHNDALATRHGVPMVPLYITPSTVAECAQRAAAVPPESRDLILIDDDTPVAVVRRLREAFPDTARVVSGYSPAQVRNLTLRARFVVDWSLVGSERMPIEAVLCGATLLTASADADPAPGTNCALGRDFALPASSVVSSVDALIGALRRPPPPAAAMAPLRESFGAGMSGRLLADRMYEAVVASGILTSSLSYGRPPPTAAGDDAADRGAVSVRGVVGRAGGRGGRTGERATYERTNEP